MGWLACPLCGTDRKYGDVVSEDGSALRRCPGCGDRERIIPLRREADPAERQLMKRGRKGFRVIASAEGSLVRLRGRLFAPAPGTERGIEAAPDE